MTPTFRLAGPSDGAIVTEILSDLYDHYYGPGARDPAGGRALRGGDHDDRRHGL